MTTCWKPKPDLYTHFLKVSRSLPSFMWRKYIESSKEFPTLLMNQKVSPMHHLCCPPWVVSPPIDQHLSTELLGNSKVCWQVCLVEPMAKDHSMPWHWHHTSANQQTPQTKKLHRKQCCFFLGGAWCLLWLEKKLPKHLRRSVGPLLRFQTEASKESHSLSLRRRPSVGST